MAQADMSSYEYMSSYESDDPQLRPSCPHGPALLFNRMTKRGSRTFFACSTCRDRKLCNFFHWADEKYTDSKRERWELERVRYVGENNHKKMYDALQDIKNGSIVKSLKYCHTCNQLFTKHKKEDHTDHDVTYNVSLHLLLHPTELLKPLDCDKKEAQYLFSKRSVKTLINVALENNIESVVCIGTPRIHEFIKTSQSQMKSILLDLDRRFHSFYGPKDFCWFNAFNFHFFFGEESEGAFVEFLHNENLMLILDPPFGGRLEPLAHTVRKINRLYKEVNPHFNCDLPVLLILPYFMEHHVITNFPSFKMIDYHVTYDNHPLFSSDSKRRKLGSPIRIFTNITIDRIVLPISENYKFCSICACWVNPQNKHCNICNQCTSKNGSTYVHCNICQKCVKPTWKHCNICNCCCLEDHECRSTKLSVKRSLLNGEEPQECVFRNAKEGCSTVVNLSKNKYIRKRNGKERTVKMRFE